MRFLAGSLGVACAVATGSLFSLPAFAQSVISTHSGVVQYVEGQAYLADKLVEPKFGQFPDIKDNQEFRTANGRAEILLTPGVFLRLGENSSIRMISTRLSDTRVEVVSGSAIIESAEMPKDNAVRLVYKNDSMDLEKQGLYRLDTNPARFAVYEGEAIVTDSSGQLILHGGKSTNLGAVLQAESFDRKPDDQDALYRWSDRRASYVAQANVASASAVSGSSSGYGYSGLGSGLGYGGLGYGYDPLAYGSAGLGYGFGGFGYNPLFLGGWMFNPMFGMYTYMPYSGFGYSPFGYMYYSPVTVGYAPYYGGSGYSYGAATPAHLTTVSNRLGALATHRGTAGLMASARSFGGRSLGGSSVGARSFGGGSFGGSSVGGGRASFGGGHGGGHR
jgi:hypothetical protein